MSRVLVIGPGALGLLLGALLAQKGHEVEVRGRRGPVERVRMEGRAYGGGPREVALSPRVREPDLVVMATKTQDLADALAQHAADLAGEAPVVALQNGLAQDALVARAVGERRAVAAVAALDAMHVEPGIVRCDREGALMLGPPSVAAVQAERILRAAVAVERTADVRGARWTKLVINLGNVVPALTGLPFQETARHPALALAHVRLAKEGLAVARAEGVRLARIPWTSPLTLHAMALAPDALAARVYRRRVARVLGDEPAYGSTWQSVERGRSVETEWLNGEVVRRGEARGVATPVNARAVALAAKGARLGADEAGRALLGT